MSELSRYLNNDGNALEKLGLKSGMLASIGTFGVAIGAAMGGGMPVLGAGIVAGTAAFMNIAFLHRLKELDGNGEVRLSELPSAADLEAAKSDVATAREQAEMEVSRTMENYRGLQHSGMSELSRYLSNEGNAMEKISLKAGLLAWAGASGVAIGTGLTGGMPLLAAAAIAGTTAFASVAFRNRLRVLEGQGEVSLGDLPSAADLEAAKSDVVAARQQTETEVSEVMENARGSEHSGYKR